MTRFIEDDERRARLGRRHRLALEDRAASPLEAAQSLTAVHGTDPASTMLGLLARCSDASIDDIEFALYEDRSIIRLLALRRTVFAVDWELAPSFWRSSEQSVVRNQLRIFLRALHATGISDPETWALEAERRLLAQLASNPGSTSTELAAADPYLGHRVSIGSAAGVAGNQSVTSRLLTYMSADGRVIRGRPRGGWTSTQFTWNTSNQWRTDWPEPPRPEAADAVIAQSWLFGHGPASIEDFTWWTGWTKGRARKAIESAGGRSVTTTSGDAFVLETDIDPVLAPAPWVAFLPALDSTTMGWKSRDFYLGNHAGELFDAVGNAGPTVWANGRIVGGWVQLENGAVAFDCYEDIGREQSQQLEEVAARLERTIASVRLKPRARRWTESERALLAPNLS